MKNCTIIGNWKLNGNYNLIFNFMFKLEKFFLQKNTLHKIIVAPPILYAQSIINHIKPRNFFIGAQNVDIHLNGAFTGEISVTMLSDIGINYVIIGHSERRILHFENDKCITKKFSILKKYGLCPILCIGENLEQKKQHKTELVCKKQIDNILYDFGNHAFSDVIIAYEPIWAIGSGKSANEKYVQNISNFIKKYISENSNIQYNNICVLYGGSINRNNVKKFLMQYDIDGVLIGSMSTEYDEFTKIIEISNTIY